MTEINFEKDYKLIKKNTFKYKTIMEEDNK